MKIDVVYIKVNESNLTNQKTIYVKDIADIYCKNRMLAKKIESLFLYKIKEDKKKFYCFSLFALMKVIEDNFKNVELKNVGASEFIVEYEPPRKANIIRELLKVFFVGCIIFFGATFSIMTFNVDAGVLDLFYILETFVMRDVNVANNLIEIGYVIGLPVGIIIFFNHFSKAKMGIDPTPMQVQIRVYEQNLDLTIMENANRKDEVIDCD